MNLIRLAKKLQIFIKMLYLLNLVLKNKINKNIRKEIQPVPLTPTRNLEFYLSKFLG